MTSQSTTVQGAAIIARTLKDLGVDTVFGIVGHPIVEIAEAAIDLGIRFLAFRNEQSASYAAGAYGYFTGRPGVCLVVGGPGVVHALAGVFNARENAFPLLLLGGSSEMYLVNKGAFQELDAVSLVRPYAKSATRPASINLLPTVIRDAYRTACLGRPGTGFVELPADLIHGTVQLRGYAPLQSTQLVAKVEAAPKGAADEEQLVAVAEALRSAKAPLVIIGKGAAYSRAEEPIRRLIEQTHIPFLASPVGKGVVPDSHACNASSARSTALKGADVVLLLGARLNWIFHFGMAPRWNSAAKIIQVDVCAEEIGRNTGSPELSVVGDVGTVVAQLLPHLKGWTHDSKSTFSQALSQATRRNEARYAKAASTLSNGAPLTFQRAYHLIRTTLDKLANPSSGPIVYIAEGANTMDVSRSAFYVEHPRLRLDAGTYATMGMGIGSAIAAHAAYNPPDALVQSPTARSGASGRKKIVCFEGDSAFGFSAMDVETMARYGMDIVVFVMNNGGVYRGDSDTKEEWQRAQKNTIEAKGKKEDQLRSWSLGWEVGYEKIADMCGGIGIKVRTEDELVDATKRGFEAEVPVVINVMMVSGKHAEVNTEWLTPPKSTDDKMSKL